MFTSLSTITKHSEEKIFAGLSILGKHAWLGNNVLEYWQTKKYCFLAMFPKGGQDRKHCFLVIFPGGGTLFPSQGIQSMKHFLAMFPKGIQSMKRCFLAMFPKGIQSMKRCFPAMFPKGIQSMKRCFPAIFSCFRGKLYWR